AETATVLPRTVQAPTAPPNSEEAEAGPEDEPMPSLSAWHRPAPDDQDRWAGQQLYAAGLGLLAGLALVVATVLWLGGWFDTSPRSKVREPSPAEKPARVAEDATPRSRAAKPESA